MLNLSHSTRIWGAEQTILRWAPLLAAQGISVAHGCRPDGDYAREWRARGYRLEPINFPEHRGLRTDGSRRLASPIGLAREVGVMGVSTAKVARVLRRYDLGHSHALFGHLEAAVAGRIARRPVLLHLHDIVQPGAGRKLLDRAVALSTASYAITSAVKDCVSESLQHKVDVQHHGVDLERFRPAPPAEKMRAALGAKPADLLVGILGRIDRRKGVDLLVDALDSLDGVRLAVIGAPHLESAEYAAELKALVVERGLNVGFYEPRDDVERVMQSLDVLVNASVAEPFGMTIVEAMACGTAVIAIKSGGVPEFVTDQQEGLLLKDRSPAALRSAICVMRDNPGLRLDMAAAGRRRAERDHDLTVQVTQIAEKYRELTRQ